MLGSLAERLKHEGSLLVERTHRHRDGSAIPVEATNSYLAFNGREYIAVVIRDIRERKRAEYEQRLIQFSLDRTVDHVIWLTVDGRMVYVNNTTCTTLGYTREELLSMSLYDIAPDFTEEMMTPVWEKLVKDTVIQFEGVHRHKDGHDIPVEVVSNYIAFEGQEYACTFSRDISERKRAEAEREALQQQIISAQRETLREISSPLIPISDKVVIMPLIGTIDSMRADQIMETLLEGVARLQADLVILDITGVPVVDTQVAQAFIQSAQAVRLLGAQVMITGIQPQIAQTLVHLGVDLRSIQTRGSLQDGIAAALPNGRGTSGV